MGTKSNDKDTYWRTGVALPIADRPKFEANLAKLGLKTVGDLVRAVTHADGLIEAMKPAVEQFMQTAAAPKASVRELNRMVKGMSQEELAELVKLAAERKAAGQS